MTKQEIAKFYEALATLAEMFDRALSPKTQELYLAALGDLGLENFQLACTRAAQECKFFPKPVELRELVIGTRQEQAEAAWASLLKVLEEGAGQYYSAFVEDGALAATVVRCWGSLIEAHAAMRSLAPDDPMYASQRKNFVSSYSSALSDKQAGKYFAGRCELENRAGVGKPGEYLQPVILATKKAVARLQMPFDGQSGELVPDAKRSLLAMNRNELQRYLPAPPKLQPLALVGAPEQELVPMPDDVRLAIEALKRGRSAPKLQLVEQQEVA
jgi:hypothetical protein